jgi:N-methylhydantoinase A
MIGALKVMSVEKGLDPRDFALAAFGGAGPVHGGELARLLGTKTLLVPRHPGILCAIGLLATDLQYNFVRTRVQRPPDYDIGAIAACFKELASAAEARLKAERVAPARRQYRRSADLRYAGQGVEITVDVADGAVDAALITRLVQDFHELHEQLYTFADHAAAVEIINFRIAATGVMDKVSLPELERSDAAPEISERRSVHFGGGGFEDTPVYRRESLLAGQRLLGPAIVDQLDTTTVLLAKQIALVDTHGSLLITEQGTEAADNDR